MWILSMCYWSCPGILCKTIWVKFLFPWQTISRKETESRATAWVSFSPSPYAMTPIHTPHPCSSKKSYVRSFNHKICMSLLIWPTVGTDMCMTFSLYQDMLSYLRKESLGGQGWYLWKSRVTFSTYQFVHRCSLFVTLVWNSDALSAMCCSCIMFSLSRVTLHWLFILGRTLSQPCGPLSLEEWVYKDYDTYAMLHKRTQSLGINCHLNCGGDNGLTICDGRCFHRMYDILLLTLLFTESHRSDFQPQTKRKQL